MLLLLLLLLLYYHTIFVQNLHYICLTFEHSFVIRSPYSKFVAFQAIYSQSVMFIIVTDDMMTQNKCRMETFLLKDTLLKIS